jgi:hypothetical protein
MAATPFLMCDRSVRRCRTTINPRCCQQALVTSAIRATKLHCFNFAHVFLRQVAPGEKTFADRD